MNKITFQAGSVQAVFSQVNIRIFNELKLGHNQVFLKAREFICPK